MHMNDYHSRATRFALYPQAHALVYPTLGLTGEAGEFADKVKKILRQGRGYSEVTIKERAELGKELGDVLWYVTNAAADLGYTLDEIAEMNIRKLSDRADRGVLEGSGDNR